MQCGAGCVAAHRSDSEQGWALFDVLVQDGPARRIHMLYTKQSVSTTRWMEGKG